MPDYFLIQECLHVLLSDPVKICFQYNNSTLAIAFWQMCCLICLGGDIIILLLFKTFEGSDIGLTQITLFTFELLDGRAHGLI